MKTFLNISVLVLVFFSSIFTVSAATRAPITVEVFTYLGPTKPELAYKPFTEQVLTNMLSGDWHSYANLGIGHRLLPEYVTASVGEGSGRSTVWFGVVFTSTEEFDPSGSTFTVFSTDIGNDPGTGNIFGKVENFGPQYIYAGTSIGIRADGTKVTSGSWSQKVKKFAFVGSACSTMNANSPEQAAEGAAWMKSMKDFAITGTWTLKESGQVYSGSYRLQQDPYPARLEILRRYTGGAAEVMVKVDPYRPVHLQYSPSVTGPWQKVASFGASGSYTAPYTSFNSGFFRTVEQ